MELQRLSIAILFLKNSFLFVYPHRQLPPFPVLIPYLFQFITYESFVSFHVRPTLILFPLT